MIRIRPEGMGDYGGWFSVGSARSNISWGIPAVSSVLAALLCGFFRETWNSDSYAKWVYTIPYVDVLHVFEMPLLGYAGSLPFGVLRAEIGDRIVGFDRKEQKTIPVSRRVR